MDQGQERGDAIDTITKLKQFKAYVHERLDAAGIPTHPDGPHSAEGCRVGDRLDIALNGVRLLREMHKFEDFEEPIEAGIPMHYDEPGEINALRAEIYSFLGTLSASAPAAEDK